MTALRGGTRDGRPMRFLTDGECLELESKLIEHIDKATELDRHAWAHGLYGFLCRDQFPRNGCQRVARWRDNSARAATHATRRWVAAELYNNFGFSRVQFTQVEIYVHVEPLFRMPGLKVYTGLIYCGKAKPRHTKLKEQIDDAISHSDNFQP